MGLSTGPLAVAVTAAYDEFLDLEGRTGEDGGYTNSKANQDRTVELPVPTDAYIFVTKFAEEYDKYANKGVIPGLASGGSDPDLIAAPLRLVGDGGNATDALAEGFAAYWAAFGISGGGDLHWDLWVGGANDAAGKTSAFALAISGIATTEPSTPSFKNLFDAVEGVVKTIKWTCSEIEFTGSGPVPHDDIENIS